METAPSLSGYISIIVFTFSVSMNIDDSDITSNNKSVVVYKARVMTLAFLFSDFGYKLGTLDFERYENTEKRIK